MPGEPAEAVRGAPGPAAPPGSPAGMTAVDREFQALRARLAGGVSPVGFSLAYLDWLAHLAGLPGRQAELAARAWRDAIELAAYAASAGPTDAASCCEPRPEDPRFTAPGWRRWPFSVFARVFLLAERWWQEATSGVPGVSPHHERVVSFAARQLLDAVSPANFGWANPEVLEATAGQQGANLVRARACSPTTGGACSPAHRPRAPNHSCPASRLRSRRARWCSAII
jgi:polyhydroxyalkanoate synthase subunit PhaC